MFKFIIFFTLLACISCGIIEHHDFNGGGHLEAAEHDTDVHHEVDHKHATSHQSFKIHHYHPVPVYIKKEDQQFVKNPVELGGTKLKLKVLHPETEHNHNHGLVLENHSETKHHEIGHYEDHHHLHHE